MSETREIDLFAYMMGEPNYYIEKRQATDQKNDEESIQSYSPEKLDQELSEFRSKLEEVLTKCEKLKEKVELSEKIVEDYSDYIKKHY